jgi:hypothetical protein
MESTLRLLVVVISHLVGVLQSEDHHGRYNVMNTQRTGWEYLKGSV